MKNNVIIDLRNISVKLGDAQILENLSMYIRDKEFITLLGPSGCGKTTTLRIIAGFLEPDSGEVVFENKVINGVPPHKRQVNTIFQRYALFPHLNVYENIAFGLRVKKMKEKEISETVKEMLNLVNLNGFERRNVNSLSGGQQQRVAIARALAVKPRVLLLDEPLGALDLKLRKDMQVELKNIQQRLGITFIYVTHDQEEALAISDRIAVMKDGHIMQIGTPNEIYAKPQNPFVAGFIGVSNFLDCDITAPAAGDASVSIKNELSITVPVSRAYTGKGKISARPEQLFFSEAGMPGTILFSTFLGDFIEYEVQLDDGQSLIVNEYTKDTSVVHDDGEKVHLSFDPHRISLYAENEEVLSL